MTSPSPDPVDPGTPSPKPWRPDPFAQVLADARRWILIEAYNGRKGPHADYEHHEMFVMAPRRSRVDDYTPLPLPSVLDTPRGTRHDEAGSTVQTGLGVRVLAGLAVAGSVVGVSILTRPVPDLLALVPGALGLAALVRTPRPRPTKAEAPTGRGEKFHLTSYEVVPEIAFVYRLLKAAPARLLDLNAETEAIAATERNWEVVLREIPRLPDEAWDLRGGTRARWVNNQSDTTAYERIMAAGSEVLVMLRAAEEKEFALAPHATRTGPWSQLTAEPVIIDLLAQAQLAQDLTPRLR